MREQFLANFAVDVKFYRRNKLLLAMALLFLGMALLYTSGSILFGSAAGRFELLQSLFGQLHAYILFFTAGLGLFLVSSQIRGRNVKLVFTKPCLPEVWLSAGFSSAIMVSFVLYAVSYVVIVILSLVWRIPLQAGFAFLTIQHFLEAVVVLSFLIFLTMALHPVLAVLFVILLNEDLFYQIRVGLLAAIRNAHGGFFLPVVEKVTWAIYLILPMYAPYEGRTTAVVMSMRVAPPQWLLLVWSLLYTATFAVLFYVLSLQLLRRKNFM